MGQFSIIRWPHCIVCLHQHPTNPVLTTYLGLELGDQLRSLLLAFLFTPCFPFRTPNVKGQFIMSLGRKPQMDREGYHDIMMFARNLKGLFWGKRQDALQRALGNHIIKDIIQQNDKKHISIIIGSQTSLRLMIRAASNWHWSC